MKTEVTPGVCRMYRKIRIYETATGYEIIGGDGHEYPFDSWSEACAFVDAWYLMQSVVTTE